MIWSISTMVNLYRRLENSLEEYEAYCYHAAAEVAPKNHLWQAEAVWAAEVKQRLRARATDWISYATNRNIDSLREHIEADNS